jgi:type I restriction enzyme S subunit
MESTWSYYALLDVDINGMDSGSAIPSLTRDHFRALPLSLPPLDEQRRIAGVLGALDDLIETNQRIRSTAEALGLALVRKAASEGFDLLDGAESEGWSLTSLGDIAATLESGGRPKGGVAGIASGVPSIGAESIKGLGQFDFSKTKFVPRSFVDTMKRGRLESRDVLVYKDGGKPGEFQPHVAMFGDGFPFDDMTINEHVYRVRAASPLSNAYLYFWLSSRRIMDEMAMLGTGAAIPGLNSTAFKSLPVAIPPVSVRDRLFPTLDALVAEALGAASDARDLSRARDELLPLLLSGRVSVREVAA